MRNQRGSSLLFVMVGLSLLVIGGFALYQSSQTTLVAAGNIAQQQAATAVSEVGINTAINYVAGITTFDTTVPNRYYASQQAVDGDGLPTLSWAGVASQTLDGFNVQYLVERLCDPPLPVTNPITQCSIGPADDITASHQVGAAAYTALGKRYFRITVRVTGRRNLEMFTQALVSR